MKKSDQAHLLDAWGTELHIERATVQ